MADTELKIIITAVDQATQILKNVTGQLGDLTKLIGAGFGANPTDDLAHQIEDIGSKAKETHGFFSEMTDKVKETFEGFNKLAEVVEYVTGGFVALAAVHLAKELADEAAASERVAIALGAVAEQAGYTVDQVGKIDKEVQKIGVSAETSRQSLAKMIQNGIDPNAAKALAKMATDLTAISGANTSETFARVAQAVDTGNTLILRRMGIVIDRQQVLNEATRQAGHYLSEQEQRQALLNAVLEQGAKITGTYASIQGTAGQLLGDMPEKVKALKEALGDLLLPSYTAILQVVTDVTVALTETIKAFSDSKDEAEGYSTEVEAASRNSSLLADAIRAVGSAIVSFLSFLRDHKEAVKEVFSILFDAATIVVGAKLIGGAIGLITAGFSALYTAGWGLAALITETLIPAIVALGTAMLAGPQGAIFVALAAGIAVAYGIYRLFNSESEKSANAHKDNDAALQKYTKTVDDHIRAQRDLIAAENAQRQAKERKSLDPSEENSHAAEEADKAVEAAKQRLEKLKEDVKKQQEDLNKSHLTGGAAEQYKADTERLAAATKQLDDAAKDYAAFSKNFAAAGGDIDRYLGGASKNFRENLDQIAFGLAHYKELSLSADEAIAESGRALSKQVKGIVTQSDYNQFFALVQQYRTAAEKAKIDVSEQLNQLSAAAADAFVRAQAEAAHGGTVGLEQFNKHYDAINQALIQSVKAQTDHQKSINQEMLATQQEQYDTGLLATRDYYSERKRIAEENTKLELVNAQVSLHTLQQDLATARTRGVGQAGVEALEQQVRNQEAKITAIKDKSSLEQQRINIDLNKALFQQNQQQIGVQVKILNDQGETLAAKLLEIQSKYDADLRNLSKNDSYTKELLAQQKALDEAAAYADNYAKGLQRLVDLQTALNDKEGDYISLLKDKGALTDLEAQDRQNDLIQRRIALTQQQVAAYYAQAEAARAAGQQDREAAALLNAIKLEDEMVRLNAQIKTTGDTIRQSFQDGLGNAFADAITGAKSWHDAMVSFVKDINKQLVNIVTKDFTQQFTKIFDGKDANGQGGLFDRIGDAITGRKNSRNADLSHKGVTTADPLYVHVVNQVKEGLAARPTAVTTRAGDFVGPPEPATSRAAAAGSALGIRNNNPGNLRDTGDDWLGKTGTNGGFLTFATPEEGLRALMVNLRNQQDLHGLNNIDSIISKYAPKGENNTQAYIAAVSKEMGRGAKEALDLHDPLVLTSLSKAVVKHENGTNPYSDTQFNKAADAALGKAPLDRQTAALEQTAAATKQQVKLVEDANAGSSNALGATEGNPMFVKAVNRLLGGDGTGQGNGGGSESGAGTGDQTFGDGTVNKYGGTSLAGTKVDDPVADQKKAEQQASAFSDMFKASKTDTPDAFSPEKVTGGLNMLGDSLPVIGGGLGQIAGKGEGATALGVIGTLIGKLGSNYLKDAGGLGGIFNGLFGGAGAGGAIGDAGQALNFAGMAEGGGVADELLSNLTMFGVAGGGLINGPGTGTSDSIHAMLSDGEYVMTAEKTQQYLPVLEAMRSGALDRLSNMPRPPGPKKFALGGLVSGLHSSAGGLVHGDRLAGAVGGGHQINMVINTPDANSFRQSQDQILNEMGIKMTRSMKRNG